MFKRLNVPRAADVLTQLTMAILAESYLSTPAFQGRSMLRPYGVPEHELGFSKLDFVSEGAQDSSEGV